MCGSYVLNVVRKVCGELGQLSANVNGCATMIYNTAAERWGVVDIFEVVKWCCVRQMPLCDMVVGSLPPALPQGEGKALS